MAFRPASETSQLVHFHEQEINVVTLRWNQCFIKRDADPNRLSGFSRRKLSSADPETQLPSAPADQQAVYTGPTGRAAPPAAAAPGITDAKKSVKSTSESFLQRVVNTYWSLHNMAYGCLFPEPGQGQNLDQNQSSAAAVWRRKILPSLPWRLARTDASVCCLSGRSGPTRSLLGQEVSNVWGPAPPWGL